MSFEIVLPGGTTDVPSSDVPLLIMKALRPDLNEGFQRAISEDHERRMRAAIASGFLPAVNPLTRLPDSLSHGSLIRLEDLRRYVEQFDIAVRIASHPAQPPAPYLKARQGRDEAERTQEENKRAQGRYTLEEAAECIAAATGADARRMRDKLCRAAYSGDLPVHEPGRPDRYTYPANPRMTQLMADPYWIPGFGEGVREFYEEAFWNDLNRWLAKSEGQISWRFPEPGQHDVDWFDASLAAAHWLGMTDVSADEAAQLLCRLNPLDKLDPESTYVDDDRESPARYRLLKRVFEDVARDSKSKRTLMHWREIAAARRLPVHDWFDEC